MTKASHWLFGGGLLLLTACKPIGFAGQQADLLRSPPPLLPTDANSFWNDRQAGVYGELTVGPALYRRGEATCRSARVTSIRDATHTTEDRTLLYCAGADGRFQLDPSLSCRAIAVSAGLACRNPEGDAVVLPPVL